MPPNTVVGFGDADAFYSSAEAVRRPWLVGVPLGVLGNQGACVIARSYSMKRCGVKVGEPIWEAKEKPIGDDIASNMLDPENVASVAEFLITLPDHVRIDEIVVLPNTFPATNRPTFQQVLEFQR